MAIPSSLRNKLIAAAGAGSMVIATIFIGGKDGVEGRKYQAYKDVAGVWTVCDGHTGNDIIRGKTYTDKECDRLLWKDLQAYGRTPSFIGMQINISNRSTSSTMTARLNSSANL